VIAALRANPFLGDLWEGRDDPFASLTGCRRIYFDAEWWSDKPRFRVVYRLFPNEDEPTLARVGCVGERQGMQVYRETLRRLPFDF
jgi:hypothetical protein